MKQIDLLESKSEFLLVTFPVDLGNRTYEENLISILGENCSVFRFAAQNSNQLEFRLDYRKNIINRCKDALHLRRVVNHFTTTGRKVIFHSISPALFSYGYWNEENTCIALDWTRFLYPRIRGEEIHRDIAWRMHKKVVNRCRKLLCFTDAVANNLISDYEVSQSRIQITPAPFDLEKITIPPRFNNSAPRFLFVGGDLKRKGGDILIDAVQKGLIQHGQLTMATNDPKANIPGINYKPGIRYGTDEHRKLFESHDVLVLPTRIDSYPQVIGEAAAAGLAIITTKYALGHSMIIKDGDAGIVTEKPEECIQAIQKIMHQSPKETHNMKLAGYKRMSQCFSKDSIITAYLQSPWNK